MPASRRIVFVNRFYWPAEPATAQLLADLAETLAANGWSVTVVACHSAAGLPARETRRGVAIVRVGPPAARTENLARRALDFLGFHAAVLRLFRREIQPGDCVVALTDPPLIGVTAGAVARHRGARILHWIQDIYPEVVPAVTPGWRTRLLSAMLRPLRDRSWRSADACVTLGNAMASFVRTTGVSDHQLHIIPNWAPAGVTLPDPVAVAALRKQWGLGERFVVAYSGNLGRVHDLGGLLDVAECLRSEPSIVFLFIGQGAHLSALQAETVRRRLENIRFLPPQPRQDLAASLGVGDLHLVSLRAGCEHLVFPSKLYGIAAVGRPLLFLGPPDADIAQLATAASFGAAFAPDAVSRIVDFLCALAADRPRHALLCAAAQRFHTEAGGHLAAAARWQDLLSTLDQPKWT